MLSILFRKFVEVIFLLQNILRLCKERKISLSELERQAGINQKSIYRWDENVPSVDKVKKVADFFGISIEELLTTDKTEDKP